MYKGYKNYETFEVANQLTSTFKDSVLKYRNSTACQADTYCEWIRVFNLRNMSTINGIVLSNNALDKARLTEIMRGL